jgi:hypothetical protein
MRKMIALLVSMAFILGTTGLAMAQTSTPAPAEKKAEEKSMEKKPMEKKPASKMMTMYETKAACLEKAGSDEAKKTKCEKQFTAKKSTKKAAAAPAEKAEKK